MHTIVSIEQGMGSHAGAWKPESIDILIITERLTSLPLYKNLGSTDFFRLTTAKVIARKEDNLINVYNNSIY